MPKAIIEFDLAEPDEKQLHYNMLKVGDYMSLLFDMDQYLRGVIKYGFHYENGKLAEGEGVSDEHNEYDLLQSVRDKLTELSNDYEIADYY